MLTTSKINKKAVVVACCFLASVVIFTPLLASAQGPDIQITPPTDPNAPIKTGEDIYGVVGKFARYIAIIFWILATISAFYSGYLYFVAAGNPEILKKAQKQIWYTVIAIVIGLMAWGLPVFVRNIITPGTP